MILILVLSAAAFFGSNDNSQDGMLKKMFENEHITVDQLSIPISSQHQMIYKHRVINIDDTMFPNASAGSLKQLRISDPYTQDVLSNLLELSELPEPKGKELSLDLMRGPFLEPTHNFTYTLQRLQNDEKGHQIYRAFATEIDSDALERIGSNGGSRKKRFTEDDVGDEEDDHKNKKTPSEGKSDVKGGSGGGRIIGGVSALQFANVNHKFRGLLSG